VTDFLLLLFIFTKSHDIYPTKSLLKELHMLQAEATKIFVDNKSALALAKNPIFHDQSKHIDTRYHFIRKCIARKEVQLEFMKS
jgi:transposase-like protein